MNPSQIYIAISIIILAIVAVLVIFVKKNKGKKLSPLAGLAFACILAGIFFGAERWIGYSLLAVGVILAIIDMIQKMKTS